jgi:predicted HAD superfamily Cof-like phosphohydrolase
MKNHVMHATLQSKLRKSENEKGKRMTVPSNFELVGDFMEAFGQAVHIEPTLRSEPVQDLRVDLIAEELDELRAAFANHDIVEVADALTDLLYVVYGAGHAFGIDLDECFYEVHKSNMSKLGEDHRPIYRDDGKVLKGPNYFPPDLARVLCIE